MPKNTKNTKDTTAVGAALEAAADSAKDAKKRAKALPAKEAKRMRSLADDAKDASSASKKSIKRNPKKVVKRAIAAVASIAKAIGGTEARRDAAKRPDPKVKAASPATTTTPAASGEELSSLTVPQLKERARNAGHTGVSRHTKAQLVELLSS